MAGGRTGGKERKLRVEQEKHVKAKERKWESQRDKSRSVERWQGWSWMQPLWAWWLIATKMSTCPRCSHCSHSARGVFINTVALTSQKGDGACVLQVESLCKCSVFVRSKNKKGSCTILCCWKVCSFLTHRVFFWRSIKKKPYEKFRYAKNVYLVPVCYIS